VNGAFVRRPEAGAAQSGEEARLTHQIRASYGARDYDYYFPSLHATYNVTENIQLRAAFAKTMGRPNISDTVPTLTISDDATFDPSAPSGFPGTIQASNSNLNPWRAKNYDYSVEYYLPRNGVVMVNWYKKDISDFFGTIDRTADAALVEELGIGSQYVGYRYRTRINIGDAMIKGWEFNLNLPLANLAPWVPYSGLAEWTKRFAVTYNETHLGLSGSRVTAADWKRYIPRSRNIGLRFNLPKFSGNFLLNKRGRMLRDTANQFPGAAEYIKGRYQLDGNLEYQFSRRFSVFVAARNLLNAPSQWEVAGPVAPEWSWLTNNEDYGTQYSLGVKGSF
jgi:TonB-dependent receptor